MAALDRPGHVGPALRRKPSWRSGQGRTPGWSRPPQPVRSGSVEMTAAVELAALVGIEPVDAALGVAAAAGRFAEGDLLAIVHHRANGASIAASVVADEDHSVQPGTSAWATFGTHTDIDSDLAAEETP
jgi:hypothetical protein